MKININKKKLFIITPILLCLIILIIFSKDYNTIYSKKPVMTNKNFKEFLSTNKNFADSCLTENENIKYYNKLYNKSIKIIYSLNKNEYISTKYRKELFSLLKDGDIYALHDKISKMNLSVVNADSLSNKFFLQALVSDMIFDTANAERFYKLAVENNKFEHSYYFFLAKFYKRNCKYNEAINTLLKVSSILNSNQKSDSNILYSELGNLYFDLRDYYNALASYSNALISLDVKNEDVEKYNVLVRIGDIMSVRGTNVEAVEYYKYALSLNNRNIMKEDNISLLLKLSNSYYNYGNYYNGLKFAKTATKKALKINNDLLAAKSIYMECLNYEYLGETEKARTACETARDMLKDKKDLQSYVQMGDMLSFASFIRNEDLAIEYYEKALSMVGKDIFLKVYLMEKIAITKSYRMNKEAFVDFKKLNDFYKNNNINSSCCTGIVKGLLEERSNLKKEAEKTYLSAERDAKYNFSSLATLYSYMSDFYANNGNKDLAKIYATKALDISKNIYRYDHHYIKYHADRLENLLKN